MKRYTWEYQVVEDTSTACGGYAKVPGVWYGLGQVYSGGWMTEHGVDGARPADTREYATRAGNAFREGNPAVSKVRIREATDARPATDLDDWHLKREARIKREREQGFS